MASLVAQRLKCLPAMRETWVQSLGWEDPLGKAMATHSSILAWRTPRTEEPDGLQSMSSQEPDMTEQLNMQQQPDMWLTERRVGSAPCPTPTYTQGP